MKTLLAGLRWGEGPCTRGGRFWVSDPHAASLWSGDGVEWHEHPLASPSNGLGLLPDGTLVAAMMDEVRIGRWHGDGIEPYCDLRAVAQGPLGDMVADEYGGLYVDDVGYSAPRGEGPRPGQVLYVAADANDVRVAASPVEFPNGICLLHEGRTLVVAETWQQRLVAFRVVAPGILTDRRTFADLSSYAGATPDGVCAAPDGGAWVATLNGKSLLKVDDDGSVTDIVDTAPELAIAVCVDDAGAVFATLADTHGLALMESVARRTVSTRLAEVRAA